MFFCPIAKLATQIEKFPCEATFVECGEVEEAGPIGAEKSQKQFSGSRASKKRWGVISTVEKAPRLRFTYVSLRLKLVAFMDRLIFFF